MHIRSTIICAVILIALSTLGCKDNLPVEPVGFWTKTSDQNQLIGTLELKENSYFVFTTSSQDHTDSSGRYSLNKNEITFEDDTCFTPGTYAYSFSSKQLSFELISDECEKRSAVLSGTWKIKK